MVLRRVWQASIGRAGPSPTTGRRNEAREVVCSDRRPSVGLAEHRSPSVARLRVAVHHDGIRYQFHPRIHPDCSAAPQICIPSASDLVYRCAPIRYISGFGTRPLLSQPPHGALVS